MAIVKIKALPKTPSITPSKTTNNYGSIKADLKDSYVRWKKLKTLFTK